MPSPAHAHVVTALLAQADGEGDLDRVAGVASPIVRAHQQQPGPGTKGGGRRAGRHALERTWQWTDPSCRRSGRRPADSSALHGNGDEGTQQDDSAQGEEGDLDCCCEGLVSGSTDVVL